MRLRRYYKGNVGYSEGRVEILKVRIYTMPLVGQKKDAIFRYFLLRNLTIMPNRKIGAK